MQVNSEVFEKLKCSVCHNYLSCGPVLVLMQDNDTDKGGSVCGRCTAPLGQSSMRNMPYEDLAQQMTFPCKYDVMGCSVKPNFLQLKLHEESCKYRQLSCPMFEPGVCEWFGMVCDLLQHCQENHSNLIVEYPVVLKHDITKTNSRTFIIKAFNILFILCAKVCLETRKIYHGVHQLENSYYGLNYNFNLSISKEADKLVRSTDIRPLKYLTDNLLTLDIECIHLFFDSLKNIKFTITVNESLNCSRCQKKLTYEVSYLHEESWLCVSCTPRTYSCPKPGCIFRDTYAKYLSHEKFYCASIKNCYICNGIISSSWYNHFKQFHSNSFLCSDGSLLSVSETEKFVFFDYNKDIIHCSYILNESYFILIMHSSIPSCKLQNYIISVSLLSYLDKTHNKIKLKKRKNHTVHPYGDWEFYIERNKFLSSYTNDNKFNIKCSIT